MGFYRRPRFAFSRVGALFLLLLAALLTPPSKALAESATLFDWNSGSDRNWPGWTWSDNVAYGYCGWTMDMDGAPPEQFQPRSFEKNDYGNEALAKIDATDRAPSTSSGGSFQVYDAGTSSIYQSAWWVWYDGRPLSERSITSAATNRWSFYLKTTGGPWLSEAGTHDTIPSYNYHIGTYLCWGTGESSGEGCPYEGPGNQHYYHFLSMNAGTWLHVLLDQHPNHRRGVQEGMPNDPTHVESGKHYLEHLHRFYMEIRTEQEDPTTMNIDEMFFYTETEPQNEESIVSLWVGYWPQPDHWEIGWNDMSYYTMSNSSHSTYEVRWSTSPITNANYDQATPITPLFFGGTDFCGAGGEKLVRRSNQWVRAAWTRFKLPDQTESANNRLYFAVKDVSVAGAHAGTVWPWTAGDGQNAPSSNVKTIDYYLRPSSAVPSPSVTPTPTAPHQPTATPDETPTPGPNPGTPEELKQLVETLQGLVKPLKFKETKSPTAVKQIQDILSSLEEACSQDFLTSSQKQKTNRVVKKVNKLLAAAKRKFRLFKVRALKKIKQLLRAV